MKTKPFKSKTAKERGIISRHERLHDQGLWESVIDRLYKREINYPPYQGKRKQDTDAD